MNEELSFERAEPVQETDRRSTSCGTCGKPITTAYFEAAGKVLCPRCKHELAAALTAGSYLKGLLLGLGGALLGAIVYFGVAALTGYEIGLIAILVGFLVGKGVRAGSGAGGLRYQITAAALTWAAISLSYAALVAKEMAQAGLDPAPGSRVEAPAANQPASAGTDATAPPLSAADLERGDPVAPRPLAIVTLLIGLPLLVGLGDLPGSLLSLVIVLIGVAQSWRMNRRLVVPISGPFSVGRSAPAA